MMALQISLPDKLAGELTRRATQQRRTAQEVVIDLLDRAVSVFDNDDFETVEQVVARIQALPRDPAVLQTDQKALAEALRTGPTDENFDLEEWQKEWAKVEEELRNMTIMDDMREGRL